MFIVVPDTLLSSVEQQENKKEKKKIPPFPPKIPPKIPPNLLHFFSEEFFGGVSEEMASLVLW